LNIGIVFFRQPPVVDPLGRLVNGRSDFMPEAGVVVCLLRSWDDLSFEIRTYLFLTRDNRDLPEIAEEHVAMVEALNVGDGKKAGTLLRMHCFRFAKEVMSREARKPAK
jgi:DNA-binding FadR family transcriptional regulator